MRTNKITKTAIAALEDIKASDITLLDVKKLSSITDTLIIATGESPRQTKALARHVRDELVGAGATVLSTEGEDTGEWVLVDAGDLVVHVMLPTARAHYALEELWSPPPKESARAKKTKAVLDAATPIIAPPPARKAPASAAQRNAERAPPPITPVEAVIASGAGIPSVRRRAPATASTRALARKASL